jgi:hypothetical protein
VGLKVPAGAWLISAKLWGDTAPGAGDVSTQVECALLRGTSFLDISGFTHDNTVGNTTAGTVDLTAVLHATASVRVSVGCLDFSTPAQVHDAELSATGIPRAVTHTGTRILGAQVRGTTTLSTRQVVVSLELPSGTWALTGKLVAGASDSSSAFSGTACDLMAGDVLLDHAQVETTTTSVLGQDSLELTGRVTLPSRATVEIPCSSLSGGSAIDFPTITAVGTPSSDVRSATTILAKTVSGPVTLAHPPGRTTILSLTVPPGRWSLWAKLWGSAVRESNNLNTVVRCLLLRGQSVVDVSVFNTPRFGIVGPHGSDLEGSGAISLGAIQPLRSRRTFSIRCDDINSNSEVHDAHLVAVGIR